MSDRIDRIYEQKQGLRKTEVGFMSGKPVINLLAEADFTQMSFMKRKARMIEATLDNVDVRIFPDELISGTFLQTWVPTLNSTFEERLIYADMNLPFPRRNNEYVNGEEVYSSDPLRLTIEELRNPEKGRWGWGHSCAGFRRILQMGYEGIAEEAERKIAQMQDSKEVDQEKQDFWESLITTGRAVCRLSDRYAKALFAMAEKEDGKRKEELEKMAQNMRQVPARPARNFWEAVQSIWFSWMCTNMFGGTDIGRLDQYLNPYYEKDLQDGAITEEQAQELIYNLFLKCFELYIALPHNAGLHPSIILAGLNADGKDGTNAITYMCLNATDRLATPAPKLSVRVNEQTPFEIYEKAQKMLLKGRNQPDFYADRVIIPAYERLGVPFEDAVEYAQSICEELSLAGLSEDCNNEGPHCDLHDKVQLAMKRVAAGETASTFEDFKAIVEEEIRKCILTEIDFHVEQTKKICRFNPQPLHSAGIIGCLESGKDIMAGGAKYNNTGSVLAGLATAADGLYAINQLVYQEKRLTMADFYDMLLHDYEGNELLRMEILNKFPKFGNDDDRVDSIAVWLFNVYADELEKHENSRGGRYKVGAWASEYRSSYMATPDGRRKGDSFAVNISPTPGRDIKGITAVIRSGTKINMKICTAGAMLDVAMNPGCIRGENGAQILMNIVKVYGELGGGGLQFNVLDADVLKAAQEDPSRYRNLMVRVWGYNDYFVSLPKSKQEHVISRTIHCGM